jgi:hypothetical protein
LVNHPVFGGPFSFDFDGRPVIEAFVQSVVVEPGDPLDNSELELGSGAPDSVADQFGLERIDERFGQSVDAPISVKCSWGRSADDGDRGFWPCGGDGIGCSAVEKVVVDLAGEVSLETADNLSVGLALLGAAFDIGNGGGVKAHTHDHCPVERAVGLAVPGGVESVSLLHS